MANTATSLWAAFAPDEDFMACAADARLANASERTSRTMDVLRFIAGLR